jgi:hypothetical protein
MPQHTRKKFVLEVINYKRVRLFFHKASGRAHFNLSYFALPLGATVEAMRGNKILGRAVSVSDGTIVSVDAFRVSGLFALDIDGAPDGYAYDIQARTSGIRTRDIIILVIPRINWGDEADWSPQRWFDTAMLADRRLAHAEFQRQREAARLIPQIRKLFPDESSFDDFIIAHGKEFSWKAMLRLARKRHAPDKNPRRL